MNVRVFATPQATAEGAARDFAEMARQAVSERGAFHAALSGGSTPKLMYAALRELDVPWQGVHLYFSDERTVGPADEQSNYHTAKVGLLDFVNVPVGQIHRIEGERDPAEAAADYAALLPRATRSGAAGHGRRRPHRFSLSRHAGDSNWAGG